MAGTASGVQVVTPTIGELLAPDVLRAAFEDDAMADALSDLRELLPEQERCDPNALADVLRSPALKAQAAALTNAMANGGVVDLLASFALPLDDPTAATAVGAAGLQAFFRALRKISR
jgi:UCH-binding domain